MKTVLKIVLVGLFQHKIILVYVTVDQILNAVYFIFQ